MTENEVLYGKSWPVESCDSSLDGAVTYAAERLSWQRERLSILCGMSPTNEVKFARRMCSESISRLVDIHDAELKKLYRRTA